MSKKFKIVRNLQDKFLSLQAKAGRKTAYGKVYDRYFKSIYQFIYFRISNRETAEDLTAEVFLKVWQYINKGKDVENLRALLYSTARHLVIDYYRKKKTISLEDIKEEKFTVSKLDMDRKMELFGDLDMLKTILLQLKKEYQEVVILRYDQDLSYDEIAKIMGKGVGAIRVLLHRAIRQLRDKTKDSREKIE